MKIEPYVHRCVDYDTGNGYEHVVTAYEVEYEIECSCCGVRLATPAQIAAHIYSELTDV